MLAYEFLFVNCPSATYIHDMDRLKDKVGMTDQLIVVAIERAIQSKRKHTMAWVRSVLSDLAPHGITTPEEWIAFEAEQATEDKKKKPEPKFGDGARTLATMIYDHLKADNALPASQNFFTKQAITGEELLTKRPLEEWTTAFQWALTESFHRQKMVNLRYLGDVVWPQYAKRNREGNAGVGDGRTNVGSTGPGSQTAGDGTGRNWSTAQSKDTGGGSKKRSELDDLSV